MHAADSDDPEKEAVSDLQAVFRRASEEAAPTYREVMADETGKYAAEKEELERSFRGIREKLEAPLGGFGNRIGGALDAERAKYKAMMQPLTDLGKSREWAELVKPPAGFADAARAASRLSDLCKPPAALTELLKPPGGLAALGLPPAFPGASDHFSTTRSGAAEWELAEQVGDQSAPFNVECGERRAEIDKSIEKFGEQRRREMDEEVERQKENIRLQAEMVARQTEGVARQTESVAAQVATNDVLAALLEVSRRQATVLEDQGRAIERSGNWWNSLLKPALLTVTTFLLGMWLWEEVGIDGVRAGWSWLCDFFGYGTV